MDIRMPVMDGYDASRYIRGLLRTDSKTIPIIALSANAFNEDIENSLKAGMNRHCAKPINTQELFSALTEKYN